MGFASLGPGGHGDQRSPWRPPLRTTWDFPEEGTKSHGGGGGGLAYRGGRLGPPLSCWVRGSGLPQSLLPRGEGFFSFKLNFLHEVKMPFFFGITFSFYSFFQYFTIV